MTAADLDFWCGKAEEIYKAQANARS
uniref:Uncharacterized protein n=1 Tax=Ralstonia solanacearum TaxID=305 RepID=A0A0S4VKY3_RALSL|nr:protein of unknown function [Ralstonia solanacearum]CUV34938.1 protein of unknown function [Ralstonia solanacearum]CUV41745.1 protein of unknown function [Ralstonia solanacearum]CUV61176.1 protein of unknown function [Ralstonia solanacearum]